MQIDPNRIRSEVVAIGAVAVLAMFVTLCLPRFELPNFIPFSYQLIELFTAFISLLVVVTSYYSLASHPQLAHANLLILGFTAVAICDLAHAFTFPGMPGYFEPDGVNRTVFFRLAGRTVEGLTMMAIAFNVVLPGRRLPWLTVGIAVCIALGWFGINHVDLLPAFIRDTHPTSSKIGYEYSLAAINAIAALLLWREAARTHHSARYLMACACVVMSAGSVILAQYYTARDFTFIFGQAFKVGAYAIVFRAAFVYAIKEPYRLLQESESKLRDSRQQLAALGDNLPDGVMYQLVTKPDSGYHLRYISAGIERLSGQTLTASDALSDASRVHDLLVPEDAALLHAAASTALRTMDIVARIVRARIGTNELRYLYLCAQPRREADGSVVWDGMAIDVTEREHIESELRTLNQELEHRVAQRTAALTQANRSLEAFSYMIAHDLRAPIRHIEGYTSLLDQDYGRQLDDQGRRLFENIRSSTAAMYRLIDGILAISRLEHAPLNIHRVDISTLVSHIVTDLRLAEPQRKLELAVELGMMADADPVLIKNVLVNLLNNAWKFTADRPMGRIEVGSVRDDQRHERQTVFFVRDNGPGFAAEEAERLFDLFQRHPNHAHVAGHGIGLASVRSIIINHGGKVWAEGTPGHGATFYFSVPQLQQDRVMANKTDVAATQPAS